MQSRQLGKTGISVSVLGFGASPLGDVFGPIDPAEGCRAVHYAIDQGITLFDVAPYYGHTLAEERLGKALAGRRNKVFLATKCGRYGADLFDFSAGRVKAGIDESLARLQTDYVDLLQAHDVEFGNFDFIVNETLPAMREVQKQGKARFIGITGYSMAMLARIAEAAPVDTILSYCRYNLMVTDLDNVLTPVAERLGVGLINASPLHMGMLTETGAPSWNPAPIEVRAAGARVAELCRARGLDVTQVALKFCLDYAHVASTLVGMASQDHVERNLRAFDVPLDSALLHDIEAAIGDATNHTWPSGRPDNN